MYSYFIYTQVRICTCVYSYVYMCAYLYVCVGVYVQIHMYILEEWFSSLSFLFYVPYSCLRTVSLEVDVQTLKSPSASPRTGKYVRVGYNKKKKKKKKKVVVDCVNVRAYICVVSWK